MSRSELERLARIRMQVTGESLERALAVLTGQPAGSAPDSEADAPQSEDVPQHEGPPRLEDVSLCEDAQTPTEDVRQPTEDLPAPAQDHDRPTPGVGRKRPSRSHLRGL